MAKRILLFLEEPEDRPEISLKSRKQPSGR
jgi:hypothetical protein